MAVLITCTCRTLMVVLFYANGTLSLGLKSAHQTLKGDWKPPCDVVGGLRKCKCKFASLKSGEAF
jgi:hypothetical protein